MANSIQLNSEAIAALCRRHHVRRLAAFGSILRADFDPRSSDADFVVEFEPVPAAVRMQDYLSLRNALASLLSRPVDLIEEGAVRNPYILEKVAEQQQVIYAA